MATKPPLGPWFIYVLRDPRDGAVRYVGTTKKPLDTRFKQHVEADRGAAPKRRLEWIYELAASGDKPDIEAVETVDDCPYSRSEASIREARWIEHFLKCGADLLNVNNRPLPLDHPGRRLRELVRARGLSEPRAAEELGVSNALVGLWATGRHTPGPPAREVLEKWSHGAIKAADWGPLPKVGNLGRSIGWLRRKRNAPRLTSPTP